MNTATSWKTTLVGAIMAALIAFQPFTTKDGFDFKKDWIQVAIAVGLSVFGIVSKDYNVSGNPSVNTDEPGAPLTVTKLPKND